MIGATGSHPVTSRTRQLSPSAPMVLGGRPPGRVGHCQGAFLLKHRVVVFSYTRESCIISFVGLVAGHANVLILKNEEREAYGLVF